MNGIRDLRQMRYRGRARLPDRARMDGINRSQPSRPVDFGFIQSLQFVADLTQQLFPPRNVGVGFDAQRRGPIHHAEHAAAHRDRLTTVVQSPAQRCDSRHKLTK